MITNTGKSIITKYMVGQTPSYASYMAIGAGSKPLTTIPTSSTTPNIATYQGYQNLQLEMVRVPIVSKGVVVENGITKVVLTAELPSQNRYGITEIGIYPAVSNSITSSDSRNILGFTQSEGWVFSNYDVPTTTRSTISIPQIPVISSATVTAASATSGTVTYTANNSFSVGQIVTITGLSTTAFNLINVPIATATATQFTVSNSATGTAVTGATATATTSTWPSGIIPSTYTDKNNNTISAKVWAILADDANLSNSSRFSYEQGFRYLSDKILVSSSAATGLTTTGTLYTPTSTDSYLFLQNFAIDLSNNSPTDTLLLGLTAITSGTDSPTGTPYCATVVLSFENSSGTPICQLQQIANFDTGNRYTVISQSLAGLQKASSNINWSSISRVSVYVNSYANGAYSALPAGSYIGLDLLRFENITDIANNPIYGLVGYSPLVTSDGNIALKNSNSSSFVEFKFVLGV